MPTQIIFSRNPDELAKKAADTLLNAIQSTLQKKPFAVLGIPGGTSIQKLFALLARTEFAEWNKVHLFMVDERMVPLNHIDSNFRLAQESFIGKLIKEKKLSPRNVHPFIIQPHLRDEGIRKYNEEFRKFGGKFDVILLGVGEDGHVASLFPQHPSLEHKPKEFFSFDNSPKLPVHRMSASLSLLREAHTVLAFISGERKREALDNFSDPAVPFRDCPAKLLNDCPHAFVFTDLESGSAKKKRISFIILGGTGDLARRKLFPAILELIEDHKISPGSSILGAAREKFSDEDYRQFIQSGIRAPIPAELNIGFFEADFSKKNFLQGLAAKLAATEKTRCSQRIFYLATDYRFFDRIIAEIKDQQLDQENGCPVKVVFEKPFGHDLKSSNHIQSVIRKAFDENQVYRI
ncbi:MAG: 6-phosphogluconolactonase, partial [Candidatus Diapherotrites archaeon]|nr:6-phosphogluconolactonase [Candidatus Diapherotrites archaeon]